MNLRPPEILLILLVLILLFGAKRLPDTAKSLGQSLKIFKKSVRDPDEPAKPAAEEPRQITAGAEPIEPSLVDEARRTET
jgi:sec-independent protein translocase protein TatA